MEVFNGTADYQIYMVLPFRLPSWRPGYYMATASFLRPSRHTVNRPVRGSFARLTRAAAFVLAVLNQTVRTELLHSTDFGLHWTRVSPGAEFIPLGPEGAFDSYTTYTSWSGGAAPLLDPKNQNRSLFYYSGGDGPHDGQRDDSIGLAYAPTHGYAGLRHIAAGAARLRTLPLELQQSCVEHVLDRLIM